MLHIDFLSHLSGLGALEKFLRLNLCSVEKSKSSRVCSAELEVNHKEQECINETIQASLISVS